MKSVTAIVVGAFALFMTVLAGMAVTSALTDDHGGGQVGIVWTGVAIAGVVAIVLWFAAIMLWKSSRKAS